MDQEFFKTCTLCGSSRLGKMNGYEEVYLLKCSSCHFVFVGKIPSPEELQQHYSNYPREIQISALTKKRYNELLNRFEKYRKTNRLLDAGCGSGHFLEVAKERGWQVYGTEYSDDAIALCIHKGFQMQKGANQDVKFENNYFDVITSFEVLEHSNTPNTDISKFYSWLRPGGMVYLTTPNFDALARYYLKVDYNVIEYPEHLSYYTARTIKKLFLKHNFSPLNIKTSGFNFGRWHKAGPSSNKNQQTNESIREKMESGWMSWVKKIMNYFLNLSKTGDSLKASFTKR